MLEDCQTLCNYLYVVDDGVITTTSDLLETFDVRLTNGISHLSGTLELRLNLSSWGRACLYDSKKASDLSYTVCRRLGSECTLKSRFIAARDQGPEYILRKQYWLREDDQCWRQGGHNLEITCSLGQ